MPARHRFTIYDAMEAKGIFERNPANAGARSEDGQMLYAGPVQFPRMLYHPNGETKITDLGEEVETARGWVVRNQKTEIVTQTVNSAEEEAEWLAKGWHKHPSPAIQ